MDLTEVGTSASFSDLRYALMFTPVHTSSHRTHSTLVEGTMQIMGQIVANGSVHAACKQHERICPKNCAQICICVLCELDLSVLADAGRKQWPISALDLSPYLHRTGKQIDMQNL